MKSRRSKATDISQKTKNKVWERDNHCCVICGNPNAMPNAHFVARSHSGLGIEQNIITLCLKCHNDYDNSDKRQEYKEIIRKYLQLKYSDWNEQELIYNKWKRFGKT